VLNRPAFAALGRSGGSNLKARTGGPFRSGDLHQKAALIRTQAFARTADNTFTRSTNPVANERARRAQPGTDFVLNTDRMAKLPSGGTIKDKA